MAFGGSGLESILSYLPFLIPIIIIELILAITALVHILKHKKFKTGNMTVWIIVVLLFQLIGPILYFTIGRADDNGDSQDQ